MNTVYFDHLNNKFNSKEEMCDFWGIDIDLFRNRIEHGYSLEESLTGRIAQKEIKDNINTQSESQSRYTVVDHLGNTFKSAKILCKYWKIDYTDFHARISCGWTVKDAIEKGRADSLKATKKSEVFCDHLGNTFDSIKDMCDYWGIIESSFYYRMEKGMKLREALETSVEHEVYDHLGNKFNNVVDMCKYWGISISTYKYRLKLGKSLEETLTLKPYEINDGVKDHLGNKFKNINAMCQYWEIAPNTFRKRLRGGLSLKDALEKPMKNQKIAAVDHKGNKFRSISAMCSYWGIKASCFNYRIASGMSLKDALEKPVKFNGIKPSDHLGQVFDSLEEMCRYWGINPATYTYRLNSGWNKKDALEKPVKEQSFLYKELMYKGD